MGNGSSKRDLAEQALQRLNQKGLHKCPRCLHSAGWTAEVLGIMVTRFREEEMTLPPPVLPCVVLTCRHCAFTSLHNLKALGLVTDNS
jgi:hypothetical protein